MKNPKCTKSLGGRGFAPDPTGGAYSNKSRENVRRTEPGVGFLGRGQLAPSPPARGLGEQ